MNENEALPEAETLERPADTPDPMATIRGDEGSMIGSLLDGRYLVKRMLGQGGFGVVYLASDEKMLSRPVVVKCLHDAETSNEWTIRKFKQEMEALARIDHPSIVGVLDTGELPDGKPYIVMQYIDGCSLRTMITPEGMAFWRAANIIRQIGRALSAAHDRGILHRDLKPENIMIQNLGGDDEQVKIIDFGIAKVKNSVVSTSTAGDRTVGTIAYMSPEQLSAGPVSPASDVYCFAVIAYEILTGRRPANPESAYQLLEMQRSGVRVKPVDLRPGLPEAAQTVLLKALSFDAKDRYQLARDFADQLAGVLMGDDEQTVPQVNAGDLPTVRDPELTVQAQESDAAPETAHVLFMDIVGYSKLLIDQQSACMKTLQAIVAGTEDFGRAQRTDRLIRLPTGDGIALVYFGDPEAPVRSALEISRALKDCPEFELRMGIHSGLVYRMADINTNMNVAGGGINIAQRVMDCGDAGHILVSKRVADDLGQLARWSPLFHDLGEAEVKHGVRVHLFNLASDEVGNPEVPAKLRPAPAKFFSKRLWVIAASVIAAALLGTAAWLALKPRNEPATLVTPPVVAPAPREQSLTYWLTVQPTTARREPFESAGQEIFGNGWRFRFNLVPAQPGALYVLNEGPGKDNQTEYNIFFPNRVENKGVADLSANQQLNAGWYRFVENTGVEKIWIIWSAASLPDLNEVFRIAAANEGVVGDPFHIEKLKSYLNRYDPKSLEVVPNKMQKRTVVKGKGDLIVGLIELSHEAY